jgi:hypothetical protein
VRQNPHSPAVEGRTLSGVQNRRYRLGIRLRAAPHISRPKREQQPDLHAISRAVPWNFPKHIRDEIIQEVALGILEGAYLAANLAEAVRFAAKAVYRSYPTLGAPVSLDARMFGDGLPLIERISESVWDRF